MRIGMQLKLLRVESDWTMDKLHDISGVSKAAISMIEAGKRSPTAETVNKLADCYGCELRIVKKGA